MALLITELAIQADGTFAIELTNTDNSNAADITGFNVFSSGSGGGTGTDLSNFGVPNSIPAGATITVGHSSIAGLDYSNATDDSVFEEAPLDHVMIGTNPFTPADSIGEDGGSDLGADIVYSCTTSRTPDGNPNDATNIGDFTQTSPFSSNTLGTAVCFAAGTLIDTPDGERAVEALRIGDPILTADGRTVPVRWVGRQMVRQRIGTVPEGLQPVKIEAEALGNGLPHTDLTVTADHGMVFDGHVINASALVNGTTIDWVPAAELPESYTVYHVETEGHEVILANGAPSESFIDYRDRRAFDNFDEYLALYGAERIIPEMPRPRISARRMVPTTIKTRLGIGASMFRGAPAQTA